MATLYYAGDSLSKFTVIKGTQDTLVSSSPGGVDYKEEVESLAAQFTVNLIPAPKATSNYNYHQEGKRGLVLTVNLRRNVTGGLAGALAQPFLGTWDKNDRLVVEMVSTDPDTPGNTTTIRARVSPGQTTVNQPAAGIAMAAAVLTADGEFDYEVS